MQNLMNAPRVFQVEFDLEKYDDKDELLQAIRDTHYLTGSTNSADALRTMKTIFTDQGRGSNGVPEIGIFMTDGQSQDTAGTARAADEVGDNRNMSALMLTLQLSFIGACAEADGVCNWNHGQRE